MGMSPIAQAAPRVAVFDVNETLSDLSGLVPRLTEVGAPPAVLPAWFVATLRDGLALHGGVPCGFCGHRELHARLDAERRRRSPRDA